MKIKISNGPNSPFRTELTARVEAYFDAHKISIKGNRLLYTKTIGIILCATILYSLQYVIPLTTGWYCTIAVLRGFTMALAGFNIGHDAAHGSYSTNKKINKTLAYAFDSMGASSYMWRTKHNTIHHSVTNTENDDDIETGNLLRLGPWQKYRKIYILQPIYAFILYSLLHIQWLFINDFKKYFVGKIGETKIPPMTVTDKIAFWIGKILFIMKSLILPILLLSPKQGLLSFIVTELSCGLVISIVFQLAHVQRKSQFVIADATGKINEEWAIHQIKTTADFGTYNPLLFLTCGGLNFQVVHHLFSDYSHVHYPKIQKILKNFCKEKGVQYNEYKTFIGALADHIVYLYKMGLPKYAH